jgi:DNA-binding NtrC family response regulator
VHKLVVLIVEDDDDLMQTFVDLLSDIFDIEQASSVDEAKAVCEATHIDYCLIDVHLKGCERGTELGPYMKEKGIGHTFMSGDHDGIEVRLPKPFSIESVVSLIYEGRK